MEINWKLRLKNKAFWLSIIPAVLLLVQLVASLFGYEWDFVYLGDKLTAIVNAAFMVMVILGIPVDMTTEGYSDSIRALSYEEPAPSIASIEDGEVDW